MNNKKERTLPLSSAERKECIDADKGKPNTGEERFDAESNKKAAEFERLIKGEFKKEFSDKVKQIISRRLKEVKQLQEKANKNEQIAKMLMEKLNIENNDTDNIERMIDENMQKTQGVNHTELLKRLIMENNLLKKEKEQRIRSTKAMSLAEKIKSQAAEAKAAYSDFDIKKELENPEFCRLIRLGVSVKNAYEVVNIDKILDANSKVAQKSTIDSIRQKNIRPVENGSELTGGILLSGGISKLTKKQRAELAKRAASGEKIEF